MTEHTWVPKGNKEFWAQAWIAENIEEAHQLIKDLQAAGQELESKLKHVTAKAERLEAQNKEFKLTIKDMDRRIMKGLKE
jgi:G:T-mismatch repair DNA endonuclease (very short patch repair protein)